MLRKLTETDGVSGDEKAVAELIRAEAEPFCSHIELGATGNLICYKEKPESKKTILLCAHMDEVGFIINKITDDGYLKFEAVGGIDSKILLSQKVRKGNVNGVISLKAVHLSDKKEREKAPSENQLYIDIGATSKEEAQNLVELGDYFAFDSEYIEQGDMVKAKALDDRVGCKMMLDILKREWKVNLICAFVTGEEIGHMGAISALSDITADYAIVIEGTSCNDLSGVPDEKRVTEFGGGIAISVMDYGSVANSELVNMLIETAEKNSIKWQYKASVRGGNDARVISVSKGGIKTASVSVPCKYIHSPVSAMNKKDYNSGFELISKFLEKMEEI